VKAWINGKTLLGMIFLVVGLVLLRITYLDRPMFFTDPHELGPLTYPRYLLYGWIAASALYLVAPAKSKDWANLRRSLPGLAVVTGTIALYILMFEWLGLVASTFLFLVVFFQVMGYRDLRRGLPIAAIGAALTWLVFEEILGVPMPQAFWTYFI
jgi:hypothetical protein